MAELTTWRIATVAFGVDRGYYRRYPQAWWMRLPNGYSGVKVALGRRGAMIVWGPYTGSGEGYE